MRLAALLLPFCFVGNLNFAVAQSPADPAIMEELPEGFPKLRFRINPFYHSIGLKLGFILNVRRERPILSTYEGEMMLGVGTGPDTVVDRQCMQAILQQGTSTRRSTLDDRQDQELRARVAEECALFNNPWRFSFLSDDLFRAMVPSKDRPVLIYYVNYYFAPSHILMQTGNQALAVFPTQPNLQINRRYSIPAWTRIQPESGVITGRIVQASIEFPVRKTYEVIIQESENANNFRAMSVSDRGLFQYINQAMLTGKRVRVSYVRLFGPHASVMSTLFNYLTNMRVTAVEIIDD